MLCTAFYYFEIILDLTWRQNTVTRSLKFLFLLLDLAERFIHGNTYVISWRCFFCKLYWFLKHFIALTFVRHYCKHIILINLLHHASINFTVDTSPFTACGSGRWVCPVTMMQTEPTQSGFRVQRLNHHSVNIVLWSGLLKRGVQRVVWGALLTKDWKTKNPIKEMGKGHK